MLWPDGLGSQSTTLNFKVFIFGGTWFWFLVKTIKVFFGIRKPKMDILCEEVDYWLRNDQGVHWDLLN